MSKIVDIVMSRGSALLERARRPQGAATGDTQSSVRDAGAVISVGAGGWRLCVMESGSGNVSRSAQGRASLPVELRNSNEIISQIQAAFSDLLPEERSQVRWVDLQVSDPQIEILDNRLIRAGIGDRESAARLAREFIGRDESAFDVCAFGPHADGDLKLIAAVPLDRVREYLNAAGDLAVRIRSIVPAAVTVIANAAADPEATVGALEIGARHTQIVLAHGDTGAIVQRVVPIGVLHLAEKLAEVQSLSADQALAMLSERDMISRLQADPSGEGEPAGRSEAALAAVAGALVRDIRQTVDDFAENRLADLPSMLLLDGCAAEISGLQPWLSGQTGFLLQAEAPQAAGQGLESPLNLLRGTNDPLIVHGKTHYRFDGDGFVADESVGSAPGPAVKVKDEPASSAGRRRKQNRQQASKLSLNDRNRRAIVMAGAAGAVLLMFLAYDAVLTPAFDQTRRNTASLGSAVDRTTAIRGQLGTLLETHERDLRVNDQVSNKILWTEKFLAISEALPSGLWLTDTTIIQDERSVGSTDVITTKLLIRGGTNLDDRKHLSEVATFIQSLEADPRFMSDFRQVTFEGMSPGESGQIGFELHAWYDQNKRKEAAAAAEGEGGALDGLKRTTDERNDRQGQFLDLGSRGGE